VKAGKLLGSCAIAQMRKDDALGCMEAVKSEHIPKFRVSFGSRNNRTL
jgi:hypothetical protein